MHQSASIRAVVLLEATKGTIVLLAGLGALSFTPHEIQMFIIQLVNHMHLNPARDHPEVFINFARNLRDGDLALMATFALGYTTVRYVEAYGLWHEKRWAEWFAAVSGAIYIPFEIYELFNGGGMLTIIALVVNITIVGLMVNELRH